MEKEYFSKHDPAILAVLRRSTVGIAGAGGLGSNAAISLARAGIGKLIIADFDTVEPSNLNRQQYYMDQIGRFKVEALQENLERINPFVEYVTHRVRLHAGNISALFAEADVMIEALDEAEMKRMLIESWIPLFPSKPLIAASGLAGVGLTGKIHVKRSGSLYICGDEETELRSGISPMAPRVGIVANMQANLALELLIKREAADG